jgi:hypothetical protein
MKTFILLAAIAAANAPAMAADAKLMPIVPIASVMQHWDNHWYVWLPQDDRYEAVEVMSVNEGPNGRPLVWAFFTERAGGKRQVHYVNDSEWARSTGWNYAPIDYTIGGRDGGPRGVDVHFMDDQHRAVAIHVSVAGAAPMIPAGLSDQSGHSANSLFLMFYRAQNTFATDWSVRIGDHEVSMSGPSYVAPFQPAYSRDVSTALFPFSTIYASVASPAPLDSRFVIFQYNPRRHSYVAAAPGRSKDLDVSPAGALRSYSDRDGSNALRITFAKPLPSPCGPPAAVQSRFTIAVAGHESLLTGSIAYRTGKRTTLNWTFDTPGWATNRSLVSSIGVDCRQSIQVVGIAPVLVSP